MEVSSPASGRADPAVRLPVHCRHLLGGLVRVKRPGSHIVAIQEGPEPPLAGSPGRDQEMRILAHKLWREGNLDVPRS